jgi:acetyltransferase-like isoleucine patch superfamily enzyme
MTIYLFKLIYIIRKKISALSERYLLLETQFLYPDRFLNLQLLKTAEFPHFNFDQSKSQLIFLGDVFIIKGRAIFVFQNDAKIVIGRNTVFNSNCSINCLENIEIGDNCLFGENVKMYDHNHQYKDLNKFINDQGYTTGRIKIGNNCWIGSNAIILKGVSIGNNSIIGVNCIIHKDVPDNSIVISDTSRQIVKVRN